MRWWRTVGLGAAAIACSGVGVLAGVDAAGQVDRFYTVPPAREARVLPAMPASSAWDWNEVPVETARIGSPADAGAAERAFFDTGDVSAPDRAVEAAAPVRVHRVRREPPVEVDDAPPSDEPEELVPEPDPTA